MRTLLSILAFLLLTTASFAQQIFSVTPDFSPRTVSPYTLTINGSAFISGAVVSWEGTQLDTTFVSAQQLTATVPCCFSLSVSTVRIVVSNPGGGTSDVFLFRNFGPYAPISSYSPTTFSPGISLTLTVRGNYFVSGAQVYFDNAAQITTFVSSTMLTASISGAFIDSRTHHSVRVEYPLVGSALLPAPAFSPFQDVPVGTSQTFSFSIVNISSSTVTLTSIVETGSTDFSNTNTCGSTLMANAACSFTITFAPTTVGTINGTITIVDSALGSPHIIQLSGTSVGAPPSPPPPPSTPGVSFSPNSLTFGNVAVGSTSSPQTTTLTNAGTATLNIASVALGGAGSGSYGITNGCGSTLAASATCNVDVTFTPLATGPIAANVTFTDDAVPSPQHVPLSGTGAAGVGVHWVKSTWTASASNPDGYNIYRGTVSGGPYTRLNPSLIPGLEYDDFAVVSSGHYCYVATAFVAANAVQESVHSGESCVTVP
jgi:hypothetical protein